MDREAVMEREREKKKRGRGEGERREGGRGGGEEGGMEGGRGKGVGRLGKVESVEVGVGGWECASRPHLAHPKRHV